MHKLKVGVGYILFLLELKIYNDKYEELPSFDWFVLILTSLIIFISNFL